MTNAAGRPTSQWRSFDIHDSLFDIRYFLNPCPISFQLIGAHLFPPWMEAFSDQQPVVSPGPCGTVCSKDSNDPSPVKAGRTWPTLGG